MQFKNQRLRVKFAGGREVVGILRSFDGLLNLVLEEAVEYLRDAADPNTVTDATRQLGQVVVRGTAITVLGPEDGLVAIANPFEGLEGEGEE
jgi:U6 snRNA-associated Sm-like protein LSm7